MSFKFQWPTFSPAFHADAARMLDGALNRGPKPKVIADDIRVHELGMGSIPPELEILEIGDLSTDRFRGIFRLTYAGDAHLVLSTKVQANPLAPAASGNSGAGDAGFGLFPTPGRGILFAAAPLIVPMQLRLSAVRLRAIVVLVVSRQKGITLVFKNDPLESVDVSSTFDSVAVIQKYLQSEIEGQLREMFREDLPGIIHRLSQRWLAGDAKRVNEEAGASAEDVPTAVPSGAKGATAQPASPAANKRETPLPKSISDPHALAETASTPATATAPLSAKRALSRTTSAAGAASSPPKSRTGAASPSTTRKRPTHTSKAASTSILPLHGELSAQQGASSSSAGSAGFGFTRSTSGGGGYGYDYGPTDDVESYDPTYGLRPDELRPPASAGYSGLARLATQAKGGLRDLAAWSSGASPPNAAATATGMGEGSFSNSWKGSDARYAASPDRNGALAGAGGGGGVTGLEEEGESDEEEEEEDLTSPRSAQLQLDFDDVEDLEGIPSSSSAIHGPDSESDEAAGDVDDVEDDDEEAAADYSRFGYPPPSAAFSDTAVEASARRSASLFGGRAEPHSPAGTARSRTAASSVGGARSSAARKSAAPKVEYETIPAVGGGTITRPRVYHIASRVQAPEVDEFDNGYNNDDDDEGEDERTARRQGSFAGTTHASSTVRGAGSTRTYSAANGASPVASPFSEVPPFASPRSAAAAGAGQGRRPPPPRMQSWTQGEYEVYDDEDDEVGEQARQTHSRSGSLSLSNSGDGSLATLEPEPMDPKSSAYRSHLYRHRSGPAYRAGYGSSETASVVSGSLSSSSHSGAGYARYGGAGGAAQRGASSHLSTAPTSQYPSTHDVASTAGKAFASSSASAPLSSSPHRSGTASAPAMTLDASAHLADLVNSNHTLSPYTRTLDTTGFTVRSAPITPGGSGASTPAHFLTQQQHGQQLPREALAAAAKAAQAEREENEVTPRPAPRRRRTFKLGSSAASSGVNTPASQRDDPLSSASSSSAAAGGAGRARPALSPVQARSRVSSRTSSAPSVDTRSSASASASSGFGRSGSYAPRGVYGHAQQQQQAAKHPLQQVVAEAEYDVDPADQARNGFAAWAGAEPKSFQSPAASTVGSASGTGGGGITAERRRSTGRAFMPPSEAALPGASRWAAIRE